MCLKVFFKIGELKNNLQMMRMYRFVLNKLNMGIRAFSCSGTHYHLKSEILTQIQPKSHPFMVAYPIESQLH